MNATDFDVVVVGFGPSGALAAGLLGQAGLRTLVIDRTREVYDKPRAIAIDHEILRVLQNLGVADKVLPHVAPFPASEHFGAQGQLIRRIDMVPPPYPLGYVPTMVFTQPPVEAALRAHVATFPSVEIALGVSFESLSQDQTGVDVRLRDEHGTVRQVSARYVIGCDGASSAVRQFVGIEYEDLVFDEPWLVVDILVDEAALGKLPATAAQFCEPARPATFIVGPGNHRRWEIMLLPGEDPREMQREPQVWKLLARWLTPQDGTMWRAASYRFHALVARDWRRGRVFIAGDAAHQQPPFIGQGMCQGMRDVANLAWKLRAVLAGEASDALLDTYGAERGRHVRTLTSRIKAIGHAICERDPEAARARDERLIAEGGGKARTVTRQEIVPPLECGLLSEHPDPANGMLFPQPWIRDGAVSRRMDDVVGTGWRILWDGRAVTPAMAPETDIPSAIVAPPAASPVDGVLVEQEGVLSGWFDRHGCIGAIIRPDHYVFGVLHQTGDASRMSGEIAERIGMPAPALVS
jgi:3-(3-hydroxy-phenyl)propionate hydroxylase